jgi:hypothetical protein
MLTRNKSDGTIPVTTELAVVAAPDPGDDALPRQTIAGPIALVKQISDKIMHREHKYDYDEEEQEVSGPGYDPAAPRNTITCMVCCEEFSSEMAHYACGKNSQFHCLCITCFADYVNHCCESWATLNTIPIKCQIPECGYELPDNVLKTLLTDAAIAPRKLWEKYGQTQLKTALSGADQKSPDVPITCAFCGKYSEFYVKASPDYWKKTERERFSARVKKEQAFFESTKRMKEEMERKLQLEQKASASYKSEDEHLAEEVEKMVTRIQRLYAQGQQKVNALRENFGEAKWDDSAVVPVPDVVFDQDLFQSLLVFDTQAILDPDIWRVTLHQLEEQMSALNSDLKDQDRTLRG